MKQPTNTMPANIMRMLAGEQKVDNLEVIINHLCSEEGAVMLTEKQQLLLKRLNMADDLMRSNQIEDTNQIARILMKRWGYGIATARRDIADAQYVWGNQRARNKNYLVMLNIDRIKRNMQKLEDRGEWELVIAYNKVLNDALKQLQDDKKQDTTPAAVILNIGSMHFNQLTGSQPDADAAFELAKKKLGNDYEDLEIIAG